MKQISISNNSTIKSAIAKLSKAGVGTLLVVDKNNSFLGTLSDGDIRKAILKTKSIKHKITQFYNKKPTIFYNKDINYDKLKKILINKKYDFIPVLDEKDKVTKVFELKDLIDKKVTLKKSQQKLSTAVVIMAGGLGTRLEPFTSVLPKPLIPINNKPVIRHIMETLSNSGISKYWITLNYKSVLMRAYFREFKKKEDINFIEEKKPLGTIGAVKLLSKKIRGDFFLTNCDTIIKTNYGDILKYHKKNRFDLTIVASLRKYEIPYGVCEIDHEYLLENLNEKPYYDLLINTGLYVIKKEVISLIPPNKKYDINEFIKSLKLKKKRIGVYPISSDSWIDVGKWSEYRDALKILS